MFYAAGRYGESGRQFAYDLNPVGGWAIVICNGAGLQGLSLLDSQSDTENVHRAETIIGYINNNYKID